MKLPPPTHHRGVHAGHFTVTITNGKVDVTRPTWADPPRTTRQIPTTQGHTHPDAQSRTPGTHHDAPSRSGDAPSRSDDGWATGDDAPGTSDGVPSGYGDAPGTRDGAPGTSGDASDLCDSAPGTCVDDSCERGDTAGMGAGTNPLTGSENDPFWGEGRPDRIVRPTRAFPLVGDPLPLAAHRPADFDPWGTEALDTG